MSKFLKIIKESAPGTTPLALGRQVAGSLLTRAGNTYTKVKASSERLKSLGRGDLSQLSHAGQKMLNRSLDIRTQRIEQFGGIGNNVVYISDSRIIRSINNYDQQKHNWHESIAGDVTSLIKESNLVYTQQFIDIINENITTLSLSNAVFKLKASRNFGEKGILYQMIPKDKHLVDYLHSKGIKYVTFLKAKFVAGLVNNTGSLYFYNKSNRPIPELTVMNVNYEYDGDRKMYRLGADVSMDIRPIVDKSRRKSDRSRVSQQSGRHVSGAEQSKNAL